MRGFLTFAYPIGKVSGFLPEVGAALKYQNQTTQGTPAFIYAGCPAFCGKAGQGRDQLYPVLETKSVKVDFRWARRDKTKTKTTQEAGQRLGFTRVLETKDQ